MGMGGVAGGALAAAGTSGGRPSKGEPSTIRCCGKNGKSWVSCLRIRPRMVRTYPGPASTAGAGIRHSAHTGTRPASRGAGWPTVTAMALSSSSGRAGSAMSSTRLPMPSGIASAATSRQSA